MYRILLTILTVLLLITTMCLILFKPKMHKNVMIYDSGYEIVVPQKDVVETKNLPVKTNKQKSKKTVKQITKQEEQKQQTPVAQSSVVKKTKTTQTVKTVEQQTKEQKQKEVILWNKWRSDIQNQVMKDAILPIVQEGTVFLFSFDVDKNGRVSNIHTWSTNPAYTPYAIQYIAPVIKSYQGREILKFPQGSQRYTTTVQGGWKISSTTAKFSSPDDYKDVETVRN